MTDTPDMPDIDIQIMPGAVVQCAIPSDPMYTMESPAEIRQKLAALKDDYSGSLGDGDEEENSGLLVLTGLELHTRPSVSVEPYELAIHPGLVGILQGVHKYAWGERLKTAAEMNEQWVASQENPEVAHQESLSGMPDPVRQFLQGVQFMGAGGKPMTSVEFSDGGAQTECCCGHKAEKHEVGETMGACNECGCARFHTH